MAPPVDLDRIDDRIAAAMRRHGERAMRISLAVIFVWFGILKPMGVSTAQPLVEATIYWMPVLTPEQWVGVVGWYEVAIGLLFLSRRTTRVAIALLAVQMVGTFLPLVLLHEVTFQAGRIPWAPTLEGQYIVKNLLIISAAIVIGGTVRGRSAAEAGRGLCDGVRRAEQGELVAVVNAGEAVGHE